MKRLRGILATCMVMMGAAPAPAPAQFAIDWQTADGGGGASTGGVYAVTGTVGQPDVDVLQGGAYTVIGGFWAIVGVIQDGEAPTLSIEIASTTSVLLSWPATAAGYVLQWREDMTTGDWADEGTPPTVVGDEFQVTVTPGSVTEFYRLHKP